VKLHIDKSVPPVAQSACRIPFYLRKKVSAELKKLEQEKEDIPGAINISDDIIGFEKTKEAHNKALYPVLQRFADWW